MNRKDLRAHMDFPFPPRAIIIQTSIPTKVVGKVYRKVHCYHARAETANKTRIKLTRCGDRAEGRTLALGVPPSYEGKSA